MDFVDIGLFASYLLIALCALAAIGIPLVQSMDNPKTLIKSGVGVALLVIVFLISYAFSDGTATAEVTAGAAKMVGAALVTTYVFFFGAILGIVYTEVSKILS
jgi:predicted cobalt transporter CbtA